MEEMKSVKALIKKTIEERYSEEGVKVMEITRMDCDTYGWKIDVKVVLNDNTGKNIHIEIGPLGEEIDIFKES